MTKPKKNEGSDGADHIRAAEAKNNGGKPVTIDPSKVLPILEDVKEHESRIAEIRGEMAGVWKRYQTAGGVKSVGQIIKKLSKMTQGERSDWLRQFDAMRESAFGDDTKDMFEDDPAAEADSNVVQHPAGTQTQAAE